jgi:hypothetical protein
MHSLPLHFPLQFEGQTFVEQSSPANPELHSHIPLFMQIPFPLQFFWQE